MQAPICLTIAGSDPSGGAGIQGDLKTFCALGAYGMAAITALTVQNSLGVLQVAPVSGHLLAAQVRAVLDDIQAQAVKIGMLGSVENVECLAQVLSGAAVPIVLDPVLVSSSGAHLLPAEAVTALREKLLPLAMVATPNQAEAEELLGRKLCGLLEVSQGARELVALGAKNVLITGGDSEVESDEVVDVWFDGSDLQLLRHRRVATQHNRGTGCALTAAICVGLARGLSPIESVVQAREFVRTRLQAPLPIGAGRGPVNHLMLE